MIVHIIVGLNDGGAEGVLARICLREPHKHIVISLMDMGKYGALLQENGVDVYCLYMNPSKLNLIKLYQLYVLIKYLEPMVVQTWMYHADLLGGIIAKIAGVPFVFWGIRHSNLTKGTIKKSTYLIMKLCSKLSYIIPKKIISCSYDAVKSHIIQGYSKKRFIVIQNGYDITKFKPMESNQFNFRKDRPTIAMVARYDIQKDHQNLINAVSMLKKQGLVFQLALIGTRMDINNSELISKLKQASLSIGEDVLLLGRSEMIPELMNEIDLHVLSSLGEAFPNVLAEAMACGTLCVSTDVGDAREIISEYGWITPPQNSEKLAEAIKSALKMKKEQPNDWQIMKEQARQHIVENFNIEYMMLKFHKQWGDL